MMDGLAYYKAFTPEPWTILGLRLLPLSLGHIHLLHRFESAFVSDSEQPGIGDLILGCFICSRKYQDTLDALEDESLERFLSTWRSKLARPTILHKLRLRRPVLIDWPKKLTAFCDYIKAGSSYPSFQVADHPMEPSALPMPAMVRAFLLAKTSLTDAELVDRPWGLCLWDYVIIRSFDGGIKLVDADEIADAFEEAKKLYERLEHGSRTEMQN